MTSERDYIMLGLLRLMVKLDVITVPFYKQLRNERTARNARWEFCMTNEKLRYRKTPIINGMMVVMMKLDILEVRLFNEWQVMKLMGK